MSVLHDLEQHPTSLFSSLLNGVSMDVLSCSMWCHHLLPNLSTKSLLHCDRRPPLGGRTRLVLHTKMISKWKFLLPSASQMHTDDTNEGVSK